jgi:DNA-binding cell septation regulator SpoVG
MPSNKILFESVKDKIKNMSDEEHKIFDNIVKEISDEMDKEIVNSILEDYKKEKSK